jgi:hypothetical protein
MNSLRRGTAFSLKRVYDGPPTKPIGETYQEKIGRLEGDSSTEVLEKEERNRAD